MNVLGWLETQDGRPGLLIDWDILDFDLLWNHWTELDETWQEVSTQCPLPILCFSADRKKKDFILEDNRHGRSVNKGDTLYSVARCYK